MMAIPVGRKGVLLHFARLRGWLGWLAIFFCVQPWTFGVTSRVSGNYIITYWETEDGLPENSATSMVQTPDGYLWFGTYNGLVRFDGINFAVFDTRNTPELPDPGIVNLYCDRKGTLWVSTYEGLAAFEKGRWRRVAAKGWPGDFVRTFAEDSRGRLYITTFDGHIVYFENDRFVELPPPAQRQGCIGHVDRQDRFWVSLASFTGYWDGSSWRRVVPEAAPGAGEFAAGPARDGDLWLIRGDVLRKYNASGVVQEQKLTEPIAGFWSLSESTNGDLWVCSYDSGVFQIRPSGAVSHYTLEAGLPHNSVRFVMQDREANFWAGTSGGGLLRVKPRTFHTFGSEAGLAERIVKSVISRPNGDILAGTYGRGIARFHAKNANPTATSFKDGPRHIQSLLEDHEGNIWVGAYSIGLHRVTEKGIVPVVPQPPGGELHVTALFEDSHHRLWAGFSDRVMVRQAGSFAPVNLGPGGEPLSRVRFFAEDLSDPAAGAIWASNEKGLFRFENGAFQEVRDRAGHSIEQVNCIKGLPDGTLWLGTTSRGLVRFRHGVLTAIDEEKGLPVRTVSTIMEDLRGKWWLGSNRGIVRVDPLNLEAAANGQASALEAYLFTTSDGMGSVECPSGYQPAAARTAEGELWFATLKGVTVVNPAKITINTNPPPVVIQTATYIDSLRKAHDVPLSGSTIRLPAGSSQFNIRFAGLSFMAPEKMRFAYRLDRDGELMAQEQTAERKLSLDLLPPGDYRLRVAAANNDGIWNREGAVLSFVVLPFFWQTAWFRFGSFGAFAAVFGLSFWRSSERRVRVQKEKFEQQRTLAEQKARLASVLEGTSDLVGFATPAGQVLYLNPAGRKLLGLPAGEDVTRIDIRDFYPPAAKELLREKALPTALAEGTWSGEAVMRTVSGEEVLTSQVLLAHRDAQGQVQFVSAIVRDISASRKIEEQLRHSHKMEALGTLASGIAHDFNNVLSAIIGNIDLARSDVGANSSALVSLNEVRKASLRARDLVQQILAFGRQSVQQRRPISLEPVIQDAVRFLRSTIPAGIEVTIEIAPDTPIVSADPSQIHQVVLNLCTNAWQAIESQAGKISLKLDRFDALAADEGLRAGSYARLTVSDNGCGIEPAALERIFEPFYTTKTRSRGTGLGLAVVHGIVKNHEGVVKVRSQPGSGASFELFFPATSSQPQPAPREGAPPAAPGGNGEKILYVDDEPPLVFLACRALERLGYRVTGFTQPSEALASFEGDPGFYDVVVTDYNMPGMSGVDLTAALRRIRPGVPVLLTSGYLSEELRQEAAAAGVTALIYKPNTVEELREAIHRWLAEHKASAAKV